MIKQKINKVNQKHSLRNDTKKYTVNDILLEIQEDTQILESLGYNMNKKNYTCKFNARAKRMYGRCTEKSHNNYLIEINEKYIRCAKPEDVHNTIMHEVIHSVDGCMNHGIPFKSVGNKVNMHYEFTTIQRCGNSEEYELNVEETAKYTVRCEKCNKIWRYQKNCKVVDGCKKGTARCPYCGKTTWAVIKWR